MAENERRIDAESLKNMNLTTIYVISSTDKFSEEDFRRSGEKDFKEYGEGSR